MTDTISQVAPKGDMSLWGLLTALASQQQWPKQDGVLVFPPRWKGLCQPGSSTAAPWAHRLIVKFEKSQAATTTSGEGQAKEGIFLSMTSVNILIPSTQSGDCPRCKGGWGTGRLKQEQYTLPAKGSVCS